MNQLTIKPELPIHFDSTMRSCLASCPQKFFNEFILGLRPAELSVDLHAGGAFSGTIESFYRETWVNHQPKDIALARSHNTFLDLWGDFTTEKKTGKTKENMWYAVQHYIATYPPASDPVQPFFLDGEPTLEFSFAIPLDGPEFPRHPVTGDPFIYVGRADLLGLYHDRPVIRDEKTASRLESNWSEKWDMRAQFLGYVWAAQKGGIDVDTVVVRGVIVTMREVRQVEAIKLYQDWEIDRWYSQLARDLHRLVKCWNDGWFDFNMGDACTQYGSCAFMTCCKSPDPSRWHSQFKVKRWNPLNRNPVDPQQSLRFPAAKTVHIGDQAPTAPISETATETPSTP